MDANNRICLKCGDELTGRSDQKFCSYRCRNVYNNKLNSDSTSVIRNINYILRRNRRILMELNDAGTSKILREDLIVRGFVFEYFTSIHVNKSNQMYRYCYDQGYLPLDENKILLVTKK